MLFQDTATDPAAAASTPEDAVANIQVVTGAEDAVARISKGDLSADMWVDLWWAVGWPIVQAIILIVVVLLVASWVRKIVTGAASKARVEITLAKFFGTLAKWAVLVLGAITILQTFGIQATSFAAVVAALGFAIGMAMSGTLGNVASGVMLLIFRPFKVGDYVNLGGTAGTVDEIDLFTTTLDTPDKRRLIVPNGSIFGSIIENVSHHTTRRVEVNVGTEYSADIDKTREVLMGAVTNVEGGLTDPEPVVYLLELGGSSINWAVRVWCVSADYWAVRERLTRDVKYALDGAGIGIPFPQMDLHIDGRMKNEA